MCKLKIYLFMNLIYLKNTWFQLILIVVFGKLKADIVVRILKFPKVTKSMQIVEPGKETLVHG